MNNKQSEVKLNVDLDLVHCVYTDATQKPYEKKEKKQEIACITEEEKKWPRNKKAMKLFGHE